MVKSSILESEVIQQMLRDSKGPRVTEEMIQSLVKDATFYIHQHLTICVLELQNGFFLVGQAAPADPDNFQVDVGAHYAMVDALRQVWKLEGYRLRQEMWERKNSGEPSPNPTV